MWAASCKKVPNGHARYGVPPLAIDPWPKMAQKFSHSNACFIFRFFCAPFAFWRCILRLMVHKAPIYHCSGAQWCLSKPTHTHKRCQNYYTHHVRDMGCKEGHRLRPLGTFLCDAAHVPYREL